MASNPNSITQNFHTMSWYVLIRRGELTQFMRKSGPKTIQSLLINYNMQHYLQPLTSDGAPRALSMLFRQPLQCTKSQSIRPPQNDNCNESLLTKSIYKNNMQFYMHPHIITMRNTHAVECRNSFRNTCRIKQ